MQRATREGPLLPAAPSIEQVFRQSRAMPMLPKEPPPPSYIRHSSVLLIMCNIQSGNDRWGRSGQSMSPPREHATKQRCRRPLFLTQRAPLLPDSCVHRPCIRDLRTCSVGTMPAMVSFSSDAGEELKPRSTKEQLVQARPKRARHRLEEIAGSMLAGRPNRTGREAQT